MSKKDFQNDKNSHRPAIKTSNTNDSYDTDEELEEIMGLTEDLSLQSRGESRNISAAPSNIVKSTGKRSTNVRDDYELDPNRTSSVVANSGQDDSAIRRIVSVKKVKTAQHKNDNQPILS